MPFDLTAYHEFLQNSLNGYSYSVTLSNGRTLVGIPIAGSFVNPFSPSASFTMHLEDGTTVEVPWSEFEGCTRI